MLGSATLLTHDPRFVLAKPAIGHFAIGAIMLKRGWMLRYMPPIVTETIPEYVTFAGYAWAALCFVLGAGTIAVAMTGDMKLWTFYVTVVLVGAKIAAFAIQYVAFRLLVGSRIRAAARAPEEIASKGRLRRLGLYGEIGYTADRVWRDLANHSGLPGRNVGETKMAVDGNWNITMSTPMGERKATLTLLSSGGTLTGTQGADGNSAEIFDGTISGDAVNWKVSITNPMPLTLEFIGKVSGDSMTGEMGIGPMGSFPFTGRGPEPMRRPARLLVPSSMHKLILFSIAALASLAGAAIAQTPSPNRRGARARSPWCRPVMSPAMPIAPTKPR